jgi:hypothetical protein
MSLAFKIMSLGVWILPEEYCNEVFLTNMIKIGKIKNVKTEDTEQ